MRAEVPPPSSPKKEKLSTPIAAGLNTSKLINYTI